MSGITQSSSTYTSEESTQSSGEVRMFSRRNRQAELELDEEGKIKPYVDFSEFNLAFQAMSEDQQSNMLKDLRPRSMYDPIQEEVEPVSLSES